MRHCEGEKEKAATLSLQFNCLMETDFNAATHKDFRWDVFWPKFELTGCPTILYPLSNIGYHYNLRTNLNLKIGLCE